MTTTTREDVRPVLMPTGSGHYGVCDLTLCGRPVGAGQYGDVPVTCGTCIRVLSVVDRPALDPKPLNPEARRAQEFRRAGWDMAERSPRFPSVADDHHVRRGLVRQHWPQLSSTLQRHFRSGWTAQRMGLERP